MNFIALSKQHWAHCVYLNSMWPDCAPVPLNVHCDCCCVWCASFKSEYPAGSCLGGFDAFLFLLLSNIFHSGRCSGECVTVQNHLLKGKKKSLEKYSSPPLLPLLHFCILNLTPTNVIWRLGYFCSVRQSSSELEGWPLLHWWPLVNMGLNRGLAWAGSLWQGRRFCRATAGISPTALHSPCSGHFHCAHCSWILEITRGIRNHDSFNKNF